jgi:hypothetical protein
VPDFTPNQWLIVGLVFLLGIVIGMALRSGGKWKARYREEADLRRDEVKRLEAENAALRKQTGERDSLRAAAARDEARRRAADEDPRAV